MKKFIYVMGLSLLMMFGTQTAFAAGEVAVIDLMRVLQEMPQRDEVVKKLDKEFDARVKSLTAEEKVAQSNMQKLQKDGLTLSATEKKKLEDSIIQFEEKAQAYTKERRQRDNEELNKLLDKIEVVVKKIAEKEKYSVVLKSEAAFYVVSAVDITEQVLKQVK